MRREQENGFIYTSKSKGKEQVYAQGQVDYGVLIDSISSLGLAENRTSRIKKVITATGDQIWSLMRTGGVITRNGEIVVQGEGNEDFLNSFFSPESEKAIAFVRGGKFETAAHQAGKNDLYLNPGQLLLVLRKNAADQLENCSRRSGPCISKFKPTKDDRLQDEGLSDVQSLILAIKNRFARAFSQAGIPLTGIISPETLSKQLVAHIVEKSKPSSLP